MSEFRILKIMKTNVLAPILCAKHAILRMSPKHGGQGGSIVNVSSVAARLGSPNEYVDYAASKGALDTFTIGLSKEVAGEGIRVNAVRPGYIYTDFHALSGDPDRVSKLESAIPMARAGGRMRWRRRLSGCCRTRLLMRPGRLLIWVVGVDLRPLCCLIRPHRWQASSHRFLCRTQYLRLTSITVGAGLPAIGPAQAIPDCQNDRTIRPSVSIAFSESSVHGLP